jgi:hypothetical protein
MRKMISTISFVGTVVLLMMACKRTIQYTELRSAVADSLKQTSIPGVFIAASNQVKPLSQTSATSLFCQRACATKTIYWVQVTYPVTICYPPDIIISGVLTQGRSAPDSIPGIIRSEGTLTETLNMRSANGILPYWCKTRYGPWIAEITDTENCDNSCGEGSHTWTMQILGVQGNISWLWNGTMQDRPQDVQYIGEPWVRATTTIDCRPFDLTNCNGTVGGGGGDGGHPAAAKISRK